MQPRVPQGCKSNLAFTADNNDNTQCASRGKHNVFCDDSGAWTHGWTVKNYMLRGSPKPSDSAIVYAE